MYFAFEMLIRHPSESIKKVNRYKNVYQEKSSS